MTDLQLEAHRRMMTTLKVHTHQMLGDDPRCKKFAVERRQRLSVRAKKLRGQGLTLTEVAAALGVSKPTVYNLLKRK